MQSNNNQHDSQNDNVRDTQINTKGTVSYYPFYLPTWTVPRDTVCHGNNYQEQEQHQMNQLDENGDNHDIKDDNAINFGIIQNLSTNQTHEMNCNSNLYQGDNNKEQSSMGKEDSK